MRGMVWLFTATLLCACASTPRSERAPVAILKDDPEHFLVLDPANGAMSQPTGPECRSPLVDPRDNTRLLLMRSAGGIGDYQVAPLHYGMHEHQWLRVRCADGKALGIIPAES